MSYSRLPRKYLKYQRVWYSGFSNTGVLGDPNIFSTCREDISLEYKHDPLSALVSTKEFNGKIRRQKSKKSNNETIHLSCILCTPSSIYRHGHIFCGEVERKNGLLRLTRLLMDSKQYAVFFSHFFFFFFTKDQPNFIIEKIHLILGTS